MKLTNQSALFQSLVIISSLKFLYEIVFRRKRWLRAFYQTNMGAQRYDKNFTQNIIFARERIICWDWFVKTGLKISNLSQRDTILMNLVTILVIFLPLEIKLKQTLIFCQLTLLNYFCRMAKFVSLYFDGYSRLLITNNVTRIFFPNVYKSCPKWFHSKNDWFWHLYKNCQRMWDIWAN